jgi:hypothetical protein
MYALYLILPIEQNKSGLFQKYAAENIACAEE